MVHRWLESVAISWASASHPSPVRAYAMARPRSRGFHDDECESRDHVVFSATGNKATIDLPEFGALGIPTSKFAMGRRALHRCMGLLLPSCGRYFQLLPSVWGHVAQCHPPMAGDLGSFLRV